MKTKPHRFWKEFRHLSSKSTLSFSPLPSRTASDFNRHFLNVAPNIIGEINAVRNLNPTSYLTSSDTVPSLKLVSVSEETISQLLSELNHRTATGCDGIPPRFLKLCSASSLLHSQNIINRSLKEFKIPALWKKANVTPIHKGGTTDLSNYRPISVLPAASKILKRVFMLQL